MEKKKDISGLEKRETNLEVFLFFFGKGGYLDQRITIVNVVRSAQLLAKPWILIQ